MSVMSNMKEVSYAVLPKEDFFKKNKECLLDVETVLATERAEITHTTRPAIRKILHLFIVGALVASLVAIVIVSVRFALQNTTPTTELPISPWNIAPVADLPGLTGNWSEPEKNITGNMETTEMTSKSKWPQPPNASEWSGVHVTYEPEQETDIVIDGTPRFTMEAEHTSRRPDSSQSLFVVQTAKRPLPKPFIVPINLEDLWEHPPPKPVVESLENLWEHPPRKPVIESLENSLSGFVNCPP